LFQFLGFCDDPICGFEIFVIYDSSLIVLYYDNNFVFWIALGLSEGHQRFKGLLELMLCLVIGG